MRRTVGRGEALGFVVADTRSPQQTERLMKIKSAVLVFVPMLLAVSAFAQEEKWDASADYSYLRFNPSLTGIQTRSFNGGGGALQWNIFKLIGIKADLQG